MISTTKAWFSIIFLLPIVPGTILSQLYMQPSSDEKGHFTNDSFFITCFTTDENMDHLSWTDRDDNKIKATEGRIHIQPTSGGQKGLELVFENVQKEDAGTYICGDTQNSISFNLIVYKSISFGDTQKTQSTPEGENAMVKCHVKGDPTPIVNWYYNGSKLADPKKYKEEEGGLLIYNVSRNDAGIYKCKAFVITNLGTQVKELDINLEVHFAPEIQEEESAVYASFGALTNLTCSANANPEPMYYWQKDGEKIYNSSDHMILNNGKESVLRFRITDDKQFGNYECEVDNTIGPKKTKNIFLKEGNVPMPPSIAVQGEDRDTVLLTIEESEADTNELPVIGFRVEYVISTEHWDKATIQDFKKDDDFVLRGMSHSSEYLLRVSALNAAGYGETSEPVKYMTQKLQVAQVVADGGAIGISLSFLAFLLNAFVLCM